MNMRTSTMDKAVQKNGHGNSLFQFFKVMHAFESKQPFARIGIDAMKLLEHIALQHANGRPLTVTEAMKLTSIASPSSIHKKIEKLRGEDLISHQYADTNRRTKYLMPSAYALKILAEMDHTLQHGAKQSHKVSKIRQHDQKRLGAG